MPDVICDTSPIQYLHQVGLLSIFPALAEAIILPQAVVAELSVGRDAGVNLPDLETLDWVAIRIPVSRPALPLINDLGPGETEVLMLALETSDCVVVLDDHLARRVAESLNLRVTGTLGLLLDAKKAGLIKAVKPILDQLDSLRFHLSHETREAVLKLAGEEAIF